MEIRIVQVFDAAYFSEFFSEWLKFRSVWLKWQWKLGILSILCAAILYFVAPGDWLVSIGILIFGGLMFFDFFLQKRKWMKDRLKSNMKDASVKFVFEEDQFQMLGPNTETIGSWNYFIDAIETEKGLFLLPASNGISIYIQKISFENRSDITLIVNRINKKQIEKRFQILTKNQL